MQIDYLHADRQRRKEAVLAPAISKRLAEVLLSPVTEEWSTKNSGSDGGHIVAQIPNDEDELTKQPPLEAVAVAVVTPAWLVATWDESK